MARTIRVVYRTTGGFVMRQASEEENERSRQLRDEIFEKWKKDPGIRFICYYRSLGAGLDGYAHHIIYEVDDIGKASEMDRDVYTTKGLLTEKYTFEVVFGSTEADELLGP